MSPFPTGKRCHPHVPTIGHHPTRRITPNIVPKYVSLQSMLSKVKARRIVKLGGHQHRQRCCRPNPRVTRDRTQLLSQPQDKENAIKDRNSTASWFTILEQRNWSVETELRTVLSPEGRSSLAGTERNAWEVRNMLWPACLRREQVTCLQHPSVMFQGPVHHTACHHHLIQNSKASCSLRDQPTLSATRDPISNAWMNDKVMHKHTYTHAHAHTTFFLN